MVLNMEMNNNKKVVTFGELMLRMPKAGMKVSDLDLTQAKFGGSEANVAVSLATLGDRVAYVTRLPEGNVGQAAANRLKSFGVETDMIHYHGNKIGSYYLQEGASRQKAQTVYDRDNTAYSTLSPRDIDWYEALKDASVLHASGITAAISQSAADTVFEALDVADELGVTVSFDINYRKGLWKYGADPHATLVRMMQRADVMFGDALEYEYITNREPVAHLLNDEDLQDHLDEYQKWVDELHDLCPRCAHMIIGIRNQIASDHHTLTALMYADKKMYHTVVHDIHPVLDPVGVGDAFAAGSIHAALHFLDDAQRWVNYSLAAATLKNRVKGDFNLTTDEEIQELLVQNKYHIK